MAGTPVTPFLENEMAKIIAKINPNTGKTVITAEGYSGPICLQKTKPFEEKLGTQVSSEPSPEMYNSEEAEQTEQQFG